MLKHASLRDIQRSSPRAERNWKTAFNVNLDSATATEYQKLAETLPSWAAEDPAFVKLYVMEYKERERRDGRDERSG